jgi:hypothetical protein
MHHDNDATLSAVLPATMAAVGNVWKDPSLPLLCRVSTRVRNTKFCRRTSVRPSIRPAAALLYCNIDPPLQQTAFRVNMRVFSKLPLSLCRQSKKLLSGFFLSEEKPCTL